MHQLFPPAESWQKGVEASENADAVLTFGQHLNPRTRRFEDAPLSSQHPSNQFNPGNRQPYERDQSLLTALSRWAQGHDIVQDLLNFDMLHKSKDGANVLFRQSQSGSVTLSLPSPEAVHGALLSLKASSMAQGKSLKEVQVKNMGSFENGVGYA